jgi:hypothetical protein
MIVDGFIVKNEETTFGSTRPKSTARLYQGRAGAFIFARNSSSAGTISVSTKNFVAA